MVVGSVLSCHLEIVMLPDGCKLPVRELMVGRDCMLVSFSLCKWDDKASSWRWPQHSVLVL